MAKRYTVAELVLGIKADIKQMKIGLRQGLSEIKTFSKDINKATSSDLTKLGMAIGGMSSVMIAAGMKGVTVFAEFEQAIANTASVTGSTTEELKELEKFARKMGKATVFTATQAGDAMYYLASAGYDAREVMSSLGGILSLAAATQYDLAETTATVVSTLRAFSMDASQASRVANVFAASISTSQATMLKLQESMKYISPVAASMNYTIEETVAALSLLYDSGLEASMSGTQLRMALVRLLKPTGQARKAIKDLGLSYKEINPAANSLVDIIYALEEANAGASEKGRLMAEIFGVRAVNAMHILVRNGAAVLEQVEDRITNTTKAAEMQQRQIDTLKGTWLLMSSAIQETSIIIGETLRPVLKSLMEAVRQLNLWFSNMPPILRSIVVGGTALAAIMMSLAATLLLLVSQLPKVIATVVMMKKVWVAFGSKLLWIVAIITTVIGALTYLTSMQEREKRKRKEMLLDYANYLNTRIKDAKLTQKNAEVVEKLSGTVDKNITKYRHLQHAIKVLNKINPGLIDQEKDLTKQLDRVRQAGKDATESLKKLAKQKEQLRQLRIADDLADAEKQLKKFRDELSGIGWGDVAKQTFYGFRSAGIVASKDVRKTFVDDLKAVDKEFAKIVMTGGKVSGTIIRKWTPNLLIVKNVLNEMSRTEEGRNRLIKIQNNLRDKSWLRAGELRKLIDEAGIGEQAVSNILSTTIGKKKSIVDTEKDILDLVKKTIKATTGIAEQEAIINQLKEDQKPLKKDDDRFKAETEEARAERSLALQLERALYDISIAGLTDIIDARQKKLDMWYKEQFNRFRNLNYNKEQAALAIKIAFGRKTLEMVKKNTEDRNAFELSLESKGIMDIFKYRMSRLDIEETAALRKAESLGIDKIKVTRKYEEERTLVLQQLENRRQNLISSMRLGAMESEASQIEDYYKRRLALEDVESKKELDNVRQTFNGRKVEVSKGVISMTELEKWYANKVEMINAKHNKKILILQNDLNKERINLENDLNTRMAEAQLVLAGKSPMETELEQEKINYMDRQDALETWLDDSLNLVIDGKLKLANVIEAYNIQEKADEKNHQSILAGIKIDYDSIEYENKLNNMQRNTSLYKQELENYLAYIDEKIEATKYDSDEYKKLMEKRRRISKQITDYEKDKTKELVDYTVKSFRVIGDAIGKTGQGATDAWKEALKQLVAMGAEYARSWAKTNLLLNIGNPAAMAKWAAAIAAISALEQVAYGRISAAAYGGEVKRTGMAKVHEGETIIPSSLANIQRGTWEDYLTSAAKSMSKSYSPGIASDKSANIVNNKTIEVKFDMNINAEGAVITSADIDEQDTFYEKFILPAEKRFKEAMQSVIREELN